MSTPITLTGAYTCTHHNDQQRAACPVCLIATLTTERDAARARAERAEDNLAALEQCHDDNCRGVVRIAAELATERARLDYLSTLGFEHRHHETGDHLGHEWTISSYGESEDVTLRDVIDAEMREGAK